MNKTSIQEFWHTIFDLGIIIKGIDGVLETISSFLVLFLSKSMLSRWFFLLARNELLEDPHDRIINFLSHALQNFSADTRIFAAVYILLHGLLNILLAVQLYREKHWAYLAAIGAILVFIVYQIYRIGIHHSLTLAIVTIFDMLFIVLIWYEYKHHIERVKNSRSEN